MNPSGNNCEPSTHINLIDAARQFEATTPPTSFDLYSMTWNSMTWCSAVWVLVSFTTTTLDSQELSLAEKQILLVENVQRLESKLLEQSLFEKDRNSERSDVLARGLKYSQSAGILVRLKESSRLLKTGTISGLKQAAKIQDSVVIDLEKLYEILESIDPLKSTRTERKRLLRQIHQIIQLIRRQQALRDRVSFDPDPVALSANQQVLIADTLAFYKQLQSPTGVDSTANPDNSGSDPKEEQKKGPKKSAQSEAEKAKTEETPATSETDDEKIGKHLIASLVRMRTAVSAIKSGKSTHSQLEMDQAIVELGRARRLFEGILLQTREKEIETTLRSLEDRFDKMLRHQTLVNQQTLELSKSKATENEIQIEAFQVSLEQRKNAIECKRAQLLLDEEGSSRAIAETLKQLTVDIEQVADRLEAPDLDDITLGIQNEILDTMADLLTAVRSEKRNPETPDNRKSSPESENVDNEVQRPLIQKIAELKIIRQMQLKINQRHKLYATKLQTAPTEEAVKIRRLIQKLSEKQRSLEEMTVDLMKGNQ